MDSKTIIQDIRSIYDRFAIPKHLRMHMYRVSAVSALIADHWEGPKIDNELVEAVGLLHDLGNVAKMRFDNQKALAICEENHDEMKKLRQKVWATYGKDAHKATTKMIKELDASPRIIEIISTEEFTYEKSIARSDDWEKKICSYSDRRVGPYGVLPMKERFREWRERHPKPDKMQRELYERLRRSSEEIEEQLEEYMTIGPGDITDSAIKPYMRA